MQGKYKIVGMAMNGYEIKGAKLNGNEVYNYIDPEYYVEYTIKNIRENDMLTEKDDDGQYLYFPSFSDGYSLVEIRDYGGPGDHRVRKNIEEFSTYELFGEYTIRIYYPKKTRYVKFGVINGDLIRGITKLIYIKTDNFTDMSNMFEICCNLTSVNTSNWNTSNVTNMSNMFEDCHELKEINLLQFNTRNVTNMENMFSGCRVLTSLDLSSFDTRNVTRMSRMFSLCYELESINISSFRTGKLTSVDRMFLGCGKLKQLDLSKWDVSSVSNMFMCFSGCRTLEILNLSTWNTSSVTRCTQMLYDVPGTVDLCYDGTNYSEWTLTEEETGFSGTFPWNQE